MTNMIEDFSVKVPMENPENGYKWTDHVELQVQDWDNPIKVAYTFNSDSENTAKQLFKALETYKELVFITGVSGVTRNYLIQNQIANYIKKLYGNLVEIEEHNERFGSYIYRMK